MNASNPLIRNISENSAFLLGVLGVILGTVGAAFGTKYLANIIAWENVLHGSTNLLVGAFTGISVFSLVAVVFLKLLATFSSSLTSEKYLMQSIEQMEGTLAKLKATKEIEKIASRDLVRLEKEVAQLMISLLERDRTTDKKLIVDMQRFAQTKREEEKKVSIQSGELI